MAQQIQPIGWSGRRDAMIALINEQPMAMVVGSSQ